LTYFLQFNFGKYDGLAGYIRLSNVFI
jgi:hypothetical protein